MISFLQRPPVQVSLVVLLILFSRLPFLSAGYGSEEDAWLLPLTAKHIAVSGQYQLSRAPAHPLQEILYSWMWNAGPFAYNAIPAAASAIAALFFALSLRQLGFRHYLFAAVAFAFTPVVFISSTYTIDYLPAMALIMAGFYFLLKNNWGASGILLGLAIGFRITSGAMLLPFLLMMNGSMKQRIGRFFLLGSITVATGLLAYLPVFRAYGLTFFTFADQFPYPNLPKVVYKATIGVFGTAGLLALAVYLFKILVRTVTGKQKFPAELPARYFYAFLVVMIIYTVSYLRLPQKSAYFIPVVPFVILLFGYFLSGREFKILCILLALSSFLFSMNLTDPLRGSAYSPLAGTFTLAGQEIFLDPLTGPAYSDYTKRLNKMAFTEKIAGKIKMEKQKTLLICGWWYNELQVSDWERTGNPNVTYVFYTDKSTLDRYLAGGYRVCYLPEQDLYNDQFSQMQYTDSVAKPYM